jgi:SAM-dependent methyltransferase
MFHPDGPSFFELCQQALVGTTEGYDLLAPKFDRTPFRTPDVLLDVVTEQVGGPGSAQAVMDLCCGTGAGLLHLRQVATERAVGLDLSQGMLDEARVRLEGAPGTAPVELVQGDALEHPFDEEFDLVSCFGAFGHILEEDEGRFCRSVAKALKPGGRFVFMTTGDPNELNWKVWVARGFNLVMRVRNALMDPPFIMYYLTFRLDAARAHLEEAGFDVDVRTGVFPMPYTPIVLVVAAKRAS